MRTKKKYSTTQEKASNREKAIPKDAIKMSPETDFFPPIIHYDEWENPIPIGSPINTAGAEDSPFITPDGRTLFFFFTPDVNVPPEKQLIDGVTGIWWTRKVDGIWLEPERIVLSDDVSLDGCPFVQGDTLWFCSIRKGNYGEVDLYTAKYVNGRWTSWKNAGEQLNLQYGVGEMHIGPDGTLYFSSSRQGGYGGKDLWMCKKDNNEWGKPINLGSNVNSDKNEDQPFITPDGKELWFTGESKLGYPGPAIFRCIKLKNGSWSQPEEIVSNFAGEPTLDSQGNIYFVHHYFNKEMKMIEADIYVAYRKSNAKETSKNSIKFIALHALKDQICGSFASLSLFFPPKKI